MSACLARWIEASWPQGGAAQLRRPSSAARACCGLCQPCSHGAQYHACAFTDVAAEGVGAGTARSPVGEAVLASRLRQQRTDGGLCKAAMRAGLEEAQYQGAASRTRASMRRATFPEEKKAKRYLPSLAALVMLCSAAGRLATGFKEGKEASDETSRGANQGSGAAGDSMRSSEREKDSAISQKLREGLVVGAVLARCSL